MVNPMRKIVTTIQFLFLFQCVGTAQGLYFLKDSTIIQWSIKENRIDTIWKATFEIFDVAVSDDGQLIAFTRWSNTISHHLLDGTIVHDPHRIVGFYSVAEKEVHDIASSADNNFGPLISPSSSRIAFNYLPKSGEWQTAIYDRLSNTISYDILPTFICAWRTDSALLSVGNKCIVQKNLVGHLQNSFPIPDTNSMAFPSLGAQLLFGGDSVLIFHCLDLRMRFFGEPSMNLFIYSHDKLKRLFTGRINVNRCFSNGTSLFVDYTDFAKHKSGKRKLMQYRPADHNVITLKSFGELVGIETR